MNLSVSLKIESSFEARCSNKDTKRLRSSSWQTSTFSFRLEHTAAIRLPCLCWALVSTYVGLVILSRIIMVLTGARTLQGAMLEWGCKSLEKEKHLLEWQLEIKKGTVEKKITWNDTDVIILPNKTVEIGFSNGFMNWLNVFHSAGGICMKYLRSFMQCHHLALSQNIRRGIFWSINWLNVPGNKERASVY